MKRRLALTFSCVLAAFLASAPARAQFVALSRCHGAFPCSIPFAVIYRPDPLLAGQYGNLAIQTAVAVRMPLAFPLSPRLDTAVSTPLKAALEDALRRSLQTGRPPIKTGDGKAGTSQAPGPAAGKEPDTPR